MWIQHNAMLKEFNTLKPEAKNSILTSKKTQHISITKIRCLMMFREINAVYSENHSNP
jgi:hypothetical protein